MYASSICTNQETCDFVHDSSIPAWFGNDGGSLSEASNSSILQTHVCLCDFSALMTYCFGQLVARERLARLKSTFNLKLVRRYRDKKGQPKIKGGPHLTQSGAYPIHLGLKAGIGLFSVALVSQLLIFLLVWHSKKRPPHVFPEKAFSYSFAIFLTGFGGLFLRCQTNRKIAIPNICVWSFLKIGRWEPYSVPTCYLADLGHLNEYMSAPIPWHVHQLQITLRKEHRPSAVPDTNMKFEDIGEDSSDSGVEHLLD